MNNTSTDAPVGHDDNPFADPQVGSEDWPFANTRVGRGSWVLDDSTDARAGDGSCTPPYTDAPVSSESIWLDNTEVSVVLRSFPSGCTEVAITLVSYYPDFGKLGGELYSDVKLSPEHARWLADNLLCAAKVCDDESRPETYPG